MVQVMVTPVQLPQAIETAFWPMLVFRGTTSVVGATASGRAVGGIREALIHRSEYGDCSSVKQGPRKVSGKIS